MESCPGPGLSGAGLLGRSNPSALSAPVRHAEAVEVDAERVRQAFYGAQGLSELTRASNQTERALRKLQSGVSDPTAERAVRSLREALVEFKRAMVVAIRLGAERAVLIETQVASEAFTDALHDQYHEVSDAFRSAYNAAITVSKRVANASAHAIESLLTHAERRDLSCRSFGALYKSAVTRESSDGARVADVLAIVREYGAMFEDRAHEYRDKVLEHANPRGSVDTRYGMTMNDRVDVRSPVDVATVVEPSSTLDPMRRGFVINAVDRPGLTSPCYRYIVHAHIAPGLHAGDHVTNSTPVVFTTDGDSGHFARFEPHCHIFYSPTGWEERDPEPVMFNTPGLDELGRAYVGYVSAITNRLRSA